MIITIDKILERPDAQLLIDGALHILLAEKQKRAEFREWLDEDKKAEFINGEVVMHSPVKKKHWAASGNLTFLLEFFTRMGDLGKIAVEKALISLSRNDYEPDIAFFSQEKAKDFYQNQMIFPAPDFIVEILSKSTAKNDKGIKHKDYAAHGIKEYWIIDPDRQSIDQYVLFGNETAYMPAKTHLYDQDIKSYVIEGFEIPVSSVFDEKINKETLQKLMSK